MLMSASSSYRSDQVPNPSKVLVILEELGLPYETSWVELEDLKKEPFEIVNPNGRVPGMLAVFLILEVQTTNIIWFESGAIVSYIVDTYDKEHKLTYTSTPEKYFLQQWSFFQASGHGPYFGQAAWSVIRLYHYHFVRVAVLVFELH